MQVSSFLIRGPIKNSQGSMTRCPVPVGVSPTPTLESSLSPRAQTLHNTSLDLDHLFTPYGVHRTTKSITTSSLISSLLSLSIVSCLSNGPPASLCQRCIFCSDPTHYAHAFALLSLLLLLPLYSFFVSLKQSSAGNASLPTIALSIAIPLPMHY